MAMALASANTISVRAGNEEDCDVIMELIKDLAVFEGMLDQVKITAEDLRRDAFHSSPPSVYTVVAEAEIPSSAESLEDSEITKIIVGYALYYKTYSTWSGQAIHLEDLFVRPEYRFKGVGDQLIKYLANLASKENYARISWECIDWNTSAMKFYRKYGAEDVTVKENWHSYRFVNETVHKLASKEN